MSTETYQVQLERVQAAIAKIEQGGQAYDIASRHMQRAELKTLYDREAYLRPLAAQETAGRTGRRVRRIAPE